MTAETPQSVSIRGAKFVAVREALVTHAYHDGEYPDGRPKYSIGFGSQTPPPKEGDVITIEDAFNRLRADIFVRETAVNKALSVTVPQGVFDALFSLYYQGGTGHLLGVAQVFNANGGKATGFACAEFHKWNFGANKIPTDGHTKRRMREGIMALDGNYGDLSVVQVFDGNPREVKSRWMEFPDAI